ncbi:hypothetical protein Prum_058550 [Phytohabitans rumicis]|uniref:Uncharacterized protein n=2 Tax=Phytohabitans rumicis TaxID=1076125 RepID=A0A6V8L4M0_9ACTN|nr:hypothetical protein Prum_058550 [Phytohabitans rumicis]
MSANLLPPVADPRHGRRRGVIILIAGVLLAGILSLVAWNAVRDRPHDPRAYTGSQSQSLDEMLQTYQLILPRCATDTVRYLQYVQGTTDSFYLYFQGERQCVDEFLDVNSMADEETFQTTGLPFDAGIEGWPQAGAKQYTALHHTLDPPDSSSLVAVDIALDLADAEVELYLRAGIL